MNADRTRRAQAALVRVGTIVWVAVGIVVLVAAVRGLPRHASARTVPEAPAPAAPAAAKGEVSAYSPRGELTSGRERVMIFIGASFCGAHREPAFPQAVERAKTAMQRQALSEGARFRAIAVSLDWHPDTAMAFLKPFGRWDELSVGGNWANDAALRYVWGAAPAQPTVPQIIVLERMVEVNNRVGVSGTREMRRLVGTTNIRSWVDSGAPL